MWSTIGSADMTGAIIDDYAHRDPRFVAIHHNPNRGVGAAITTGYLQAVEDGMDIAAVMAGDNQMDATYLPDLLDPIVDGRADYTKGNHHQRGLPDGDAAVAEFRQLPPHLPAQGRLGLLADDGPQNGYTAISTKTLATLPLDSVYQGYGYCSNLLVWLNIYNMRVQDIAIPRRYGQGDRGFATRPTSRGSQSFSSITSSSV